MLIVDYLFFGFILLLTIQGIINLTLSLYAWEHPDRVEESTSPKNFANPTKSFTVLLPARHEETVIADTLFRIANLNYPKKLFEVLVVCEDSDRGTIDAARKIASEKMLSNVKIIGFKDRPINKPHGLNVGLDIAKNEIVTIFDAEDEVHPDILNIANTIYVEKNPDIVQAGVQLMNYNSRWFSIHNVLEYYFWFKSRMHFHARVGMVPLGGNTVFFKTDDIRNIGGWDESCLTEDADIGIQLSVKGKTVAVTYDAKHVTREETPDSVSSFIKQRTRWNQGFIQVLKKGVWKDYDTIGKSIFCVYTLIFPIMQAVLLGLTPLLIYIGFNTNLPFIFSFISFLPVLIIILQLIVYLVGFHEFSREQKIKANPLWYLSLIITFLPYQLLLGISAVRASYRELIGKNDWEKTAHSGLHRKESLNNLGTTG